MFEGAAIEAPLPPYDTSKGKNFSHMFEDGYFFGDPMPGVEFDVSNGRDFSYMFANNSGLPPVISLDTRNGWQFNNMFDGAYDYTGEQSNISVSLDFSQVSNTQAAFSSEVITSITLVPPVREYWDNWAGLATFKAPNLKSLIFTGESQIRSNLYLNYAPLLTTEVLHAIIEKLADANGKGSNAIFKVGSTNLAKIDEEHIAMLVAKNWTYS